MMIDLHSHTTASEGQHSPTKLIQLASQAGITHLAVTDHDTVAGLKEAGEAARNIGLTLILGIEVSAFIDDKEVHILGHFIATEGTEMAAFESNARKERYQRMEKMVRKLNDLGFPITMQQVLAVAQDAKRGRPHLAGVLVSSFLLHGYLSLVRSSRERGSVRDCSLSCGSQPEPEDQVLGAGPSV